MRSEDYYEPPATSNQLYMPGTPIKSANVVLYLDLDGVVQHEAVFFHPKRGIYMSPAVAAERYLFEWVPILIEILEPYPSVRLVLSSSWCIRPGYGKTLKKLPEALRCRFIGGTYHKRIHGADLYTESSFRNMSRGEQVLADVNRRRPRHWMALDDDVEDWPQAALAQLIPCEGGTGLSDVGVQKELESRLRRVLG